MVFGYVRVFTPSQPWIVSFTQDLLTIIDQFEKQVVKVVNIKEQVK